MFDDYFGHLALEITNSCNLKCKMCSIWREKPNAELSREEVVGIIEKLNARYGALGKRYSPLVTLTGGEPFLHPQFDSIYKAVNSFALSGKAGKMYIITNGFFTDKILEFLGRNDTSNLRMDFSIDGMEENHNSQRGDKESFKKAIETIGAIREEFPSVPVSVKFTFNGKNIKDAHSVYEYCKENGLSIRFLTMDFPWNGYFNRYAEDRRKGSIGISDAQKAEILRVLSEIYSDIRRSGKIDMVVGRRYHISSLMRNLGPVHVERCTSPAKELFINSHGDVYPCIYKKPIANIREHGWENNILGDYHTRLIEEGAMRKCPMCGQHCNFLKITETVL